MRCEEYLPLINELLNKTLSPTEKRGVEDHLAACENCQAEFQRLKKADDLLREVVCDMFSEIEVPAYLSRRIKETLEKEQEQRARATRSGWRSAFLKIPAVAAALFLFIAAGTFGYQHVFGPSAKQSEVVLQEPSVTDESEPFISYDRAVSPAGPGQDPGSSGPANVQEKSAPVKPPENLLKSKPEGTQNVVSGSEAIRIARENAPAGKGGEPEPETTTTKQRGGAGASMSAGQAVDPPQLEGTQPLEDRRLFAAGQSFATGGDAGVEGSGKDSFAQGTLEDAAKDLGFTCLEPDYLPRGAELQEVNRLSGTVYQNYRIGQLSFQISQSQVGASEAKIKPPSQENVIEINGARGILEETGHGAENGTSKGYTTIIWQQGELLLSVGGELPREELVKIASSMK